MKTIVSYECEICNLRYDNEQEAIKCEARPRPSRLPIGLVFNNASDRNEFYFNMTFALAECEIDRHYRKATLWACRNNGAGDSLGKELCGNGNEFHLNETDRPDPNHPTFKRLVDWLQTTNIPITVWDGTKIVDLKTFLTSPPKPATLKA